MKIFGKGGMIDFTPPQTSEELIEQWNTLDSQPSCDREQLYAVENELDDTFGLVKSGNEWIDPSADDEPEPRGFWGKLFE